MGRFGSNLALMELKSFRLRSTRWTNYIKLTSITHEGFSRACIVAVACLWWISLPAGVKLLYQALGNNPNNAFLPQFTVTRSGGTGGDPDIQYPLAHTVIGKDPKVLADMIAAAKSVGVQFK